MSSEERMRKILETYGGEIAKKSALIMFEETESNELKNIWEFVAKNWHDPLRPAMIRLSCEAVRGKKTDIEKIAVVMNLMNLSFYLWDDLIDQAPSRLFKPTLYGKYGKEITLMAGGLASAKAFTILNQIKIEETKRQVITSLFWNMWNSMAEAENANLKVRNENYTSKDKFAKIEKESIASIGTCLRIGAIMGNGSDRDVEYLTNYGKYIGIILELQHDFRVAINQTVELYDKIKTGALPYTILWVKEHSPQIQKTIKEIINNGNFEPKKGEYIIRSISTTKATKEIYCKIEELTEKAINELKLIEKNSASKALLSFVEVQPQLFKELLSY